MAGRFPRICLVGNLSGPKDEAMKKVADKFVLNLAGKHIVLPLHIGGVFSPSFWLRLKRFRPDIIFYVGGPSFFTFLVTTVARTYCWIAVRVRPKVVIFALHPYLPAFFDGLSIALRPDSMLVQSIQSQRRFQKLGMNTRFLPVGVELERFKPVDSSEKVRLRHKYGLKTSEFVVLHVGSVRKNRGLEILERVQMNDQNRVLIIGSTSMPMDRSVFKELTASGCLVWRRHFREIEELYQLADVYVFPVVDALGSIELPLSVVEAMACNLPMILTRFGALPRILDEKEGLIFVDNADDIPLRIEQMKKEGLIARTRETATEFSWINITEELSGCFCQLFEENRK